MSAVKKSMVSISKKDYSALLEFLKASNSYFGTRMGERNHGRQMAFDKAYSLLPKKFREHKE